MTNIAPKALPTENLENILLDRAGSPLRLQAVLNEYKTRDDKNPDIERQLKMPGNRP